MIGSSHKGPEHRQMVEESDWGGVVVRESEKGTTQKSDHRPKQTFKEG